jgi:hypothetical protein
VPDRDAIPHYWVLLSQAAQRSSYVLRDPAGYRMSLKQ